MISEFRAWAIVQTALLVAVLAILFFLLGILDSVQQTLLSAGP